MFKTVFAAGLIWTILAVTGLTERSFGSDSGVASVGDGGRSISVLAQKRYDRRYMPTINAIGEEMKALEIPGAAVAVIEGGETTLTAGFGTAHPHRDVPVQPSTLFRIGSVTKTLTAIGLLQLVDRGWVDLDAPITNYLPDFAFAHDETWAPSITPRHLLTHTSAVADYFEMDPPEFQDDDALSTFFSGPYRELPSAYLMAPAGRMFNYSNPGYMLAGWVTESASGTYYRQYLEENVFAPLGVARTFFLPERVVADGDFAYGSALHWETGEPFVVEPNSYDNGWGRPAGLAFSSVLDLAEVVKFLRAGQPDVLADDLRMAMQEPQVDTELFMDLLHYGYGLMIQEGGFYHPEGSNFYRLRLLWHGGDVSGFSADLWYVPELDFGFVALTNASYAHLNASFTTALTTLCDMPAPDPLPDFSMTPAGYSGYAGRYHDRHNIGDITVKSDAGQLTVEIPSLDGLGLDYDRALVPSVGDNYILFINSDPRMEKLPLQVTFIFDEEGLPEYFRTRSFVARYMGETAIDPDRPRRFQWLQATESLAVPDLRSHLPGPHVPFIVPPAR